MHIRLLLALLVVCVAITGAGTSTPQESQEDNGRPDSGGADLDTQLAAYLDDAALEELRARYSAQVAWLTQAYDELDMGIYITQRQVEITLRNRAIKRYTAHLLRRIIGEQFFLSEPKHTQPEQQEPAEVAVRDLLVARAQLRAKLMMTRANKLHWLALWKNFESFRGYYEDSEARQLGSLTPRESLLPQAELRHQTRAYERVRELLGTRVTMAELLGVLDRLLDAYTHCTTCPELARLATRWGRAAPLQRDFMVGEWLMAADEHGDAQFARTLEGDMAAFVERKKLRVMSLASLKDPFELDAMEKWRNATLTSATV